MAEPKVLTPTNLILLYGQGGIGKSTLIAQAAAHIYKTTGLRTRIIGADGGGTKAFKLLIDEGIVEYCPIDLWDDTSIFNVLDFVTKGSWPADPLTPNSELLPPFETYRECLKCKKDIGGKGVVAKCGACGVVVGAGERPPRRINLINGFEKIGLVAFEGLSAFGTILLNRLRRIDPTGGRIIKDGDYNISALGQQHYGDAQNYITQYVANTRLIPVPMVLWSALELRGQDDGYGKPIFGPALPGKKLTALCVPWFTDVLHIDGVPKQRDASGVEVMERTIFLAQHFPADTKPYGFVAKTSAPLEGGMPLTIPFTSTGNTMTTYFNELDKAYEKARKAVLG